MIHYRNDRPITAEQLASVFDRSGIRRPMHDLPRLQTMLDHADILWTAWEGEELVGVARSITDFAYCCYLSDLAVDQRRQKQGIGRALIQRTKEQLGDGVSLILLSAPGAVAYYPKIGMAHADNAFIIKRKG